MVLKTRANNVVLRFMIGIVDWNAHNLLSIDPTCLIRILSILAQSCQSP